MVVRRFFFPAKAPVRAVSLASVANAASSRRLAKDPATRPSAGGGSAVGRPWRDLFTRKGRLQRMEGGWLRPFAWFCRLGTASAALLGSETIGSWNCGGRWRWAREYRRKAALFFFFLFVCSFLFSRPGHVSGVGCGLSHQPMWVELNAPRRDVSLIR